MPEPIEGYDPDDPLLPGISLAEYCKAAGISYSEFARRLPCSVAYPRMIATGKAWPSYSMATRIERMTDRHVPRTRWYPPEDKNNA